jgi:DNA-directed RNA polymerase sigma subunit (sigma70/sigma32)
MKDYTKPQELLDFTTTEEQEQITTEEMLSDVLGKIIAKLNELEARIIALEPKKK